MQICISSLTALSDQLETTRSSALAETRGNAVAANLLMSRNPKGKYNKNTPCWARHCVRTVGSGPIKRRRNRLPSGYGPVAIKR